MASIKRIACGLTEDSGIVEGTAEFFYLDTAEETADLQILLIEQLRELRGVEDQLIDSLAKLAEVPDAIPMYEGLEARLQDVRDHSRRLEGVLVSVCESPSARSSKTNGMRRTKKLAPVAKTLNFKTR